MEPLYPLLCRPLYQDRIWGGRRLARLYGKELPGGADRPIGESWEVADLANGASSIGNGPLEGRSLTEVTAALGESLVGSAWPAGAFPLLVKLLDAQDDLSVQVHPSAADCAQWFPADASKDETWVVVDADPGARVFYGFQPGVTRAAFEHHLEAETLLDILQPVAVRAGDVLRVAPGTVHALGRGVAVLEVQEPSDTTFRLYDFGRGRQVHLAEGQRVVRLDSGAPLLAPEVVETDWGVHELLVDVPAYRLERLSAEEEVFWRIDPRSVQVLTLLEGTAQLGWDEEQCLRLSAGDTVIVPAGLGVTQLEPLGAIVAVLAGAGGGELCDWHHA